MIDPARAKGVSAGGEERVSTAPVLCVDGVTQRYGDFLALNDVTMKVHQGAIHAVVGPNGAGKSTLFNVLAGKIPPTQGKVKYFGQDISGHVNERKVAELGIGRSFQITSLFGPLSVAENVLAASGAFVLTRRKALEPLEGSQYGGLDGLLDFVGLGGMHRRPADTLSHGERRRLEIAVALARNPRLVLLDEPTSGMGADDIPRMIELLQSLRDNHTVLFVEHNMTLTLSVATHMTVLVGGAIVADGTPGEVKESEAVRVGYLGA